ncbi:hypothetical protein AX17_001948 [Amanita inopinata Kibby_2008]|nr:hypothetical protein AX17_001948 [Amanita inopinata Kibby_2008]
MQSQALFDSSIKRAPPSSNWLALQKNIHKISPNGMVVQSSSPRKHRKLSHLSQPTSKARSNMSINDLEAPSAIDNGESMDELRRIVLGKVTHSAERLLPGKYIAIDCEMVGVGIDGVESSLARISLVNYYGVVQLDEFVKQRERVIDYRTQHSGIRDTDMLKAKPFEEVQKTVAEILKDRIIVGHAVHNDLKALLLSHPRSHIRDTQVLAGKFKLVKSKYVALRNLVKQELNVTIQSGEHSSVVDARATMAIYRLHRKEWEKSLSRLRNNKEKTKRNSNSDCPVTIEVDQVPSGEAYDSIRSKNLVYVQGKPSGRGKRSIKGDSQWWKEVERDSWQKDGGLLG